VIGSRRVQLSRERDEERSPHRFDVDHILERHRTEQLGSEADAVKRRVAQWGRQHRALGQGVANPSLEQGDIGDPRRIRCASVWIYVCRPCALERLQRGADHSREAADVFELGKTGVLKRSRNTGVKCLTVRKVAEATCKTRSEQGQSQDFQSDFVGLGCLKTPHAPRQRTIHHDKTSYHDPFSPFVIDDGAVGFSRKNVEIQSIDVCLRERAIRPRLGGFVRDRSSRGETPEITPIRSGRRNARRKGSWPGCAQNQSGISADESSF
jgi:hypothetical protein